MNDNDLLAAIGQYEKAALGSSVAIGPSVGGSIRPTNQQMTTLEIDRYNALNTYFGRPMGNEVDNRSQVVLPELRDTIEWIMPQLMRMFAATQKICVFDPVNPNDEQQSDIESQAVNAVLMKQNDGFFILHDMFKDALLLRNGYAKVWWEEDTKTTVESFSGITEDELPNLLAEDEKTKIEVLSQTEDQQVVNGAPVAVFSLKIRKTAKVGRVRVECVPPEEILVSPQARHKLDECPFIEHKTKVSRSKLKEEGFDAKIVDSIGISSPTWLNLISIARDEVTDQLSEENPSDMASQDVDFREVYIRVDYDDDGIAELRRVFIGGDKILENEECEEMPVAYASPIRMPHRHVGISFTDLLTDLQIIKTTLFRNGLDNIYQTNNKRTVINENNVNIDDILNNRPGGIIRTKGIPGEDVLFMDTQGGMLEQIIPAMEYVDSIREMRTGIGKDTMGVDADALQDVTKGGQLAAMSAAAMKVELVARLLAEGVKDLCLKIHSVMRRHQDQPLMFQLGGQWVNVNPSEWQERTGITVQVGLGSGNREEVRANLMLLAQAQGALKDFGLVQAPQAFETFKEVARVLGFDKAERFAMDPNSPQYQQAMAQHQPQLPPQAMVAQIKAASDQKIAQMDMQRDQMKAQAQAQSDHEREMTARIQAQANITHGAMEGAHDRQVDLVQAQSQWEQTLVKVIGQIVAAQLKQLPGPNAGQVLQQDMRGFQ